MRTTTTLSLFALAASAGAFIYYIERKAPSTSELAATAHLLATASAEDTVEIQINDASGKVELRRDGPDKPWRIVHPFRDRADPEAASSLFSLATSLEIVEEVSSAYEIQGIDPFDAASRELVLEDAAGDPLVAVLLGKPAALTNTVYARNLLGDPETVSVVRSPHLDIIGRAATTLRDPRLLDLAAGDVTTLRIRSAAGGVDLTRLSPASGSTKASWQITQPLDTAAEPGAIDAIVTALTDARVRARPATTTESAATPAAFEDPTATVTLVAGTEDKTTVRLLETSPGTVLATTSDRRPVVFEVSPSILSAVLTPPQLLRSTTLATIDPEALVGLDISLAGGPTTVLTRSGASWMLGEKGSPKKPVDANSERISAFVETVNSTPVLKFANDAPTDLAPYGLENPAAVITFTVAADPNSPEVTSTSSLLLGRSSAPDESIEGRLYATFTDRPFVYEVGPSLLAALPTDPIAWRSTQITGISAFDLQSITIAEGAQPPFSLVRNPTTFRWTATRPGVDLTSRLDQQRANLVAAALSSFYADRWLTRRGEALDRLDQNPSLVVTITLSGGQPPIVLRFAPPSDDAADPEFYIGTREGLPEVFLVGKVTYSALTRSLLED